MENTELTPRVQRRILRTMKHKGIDGKYPQAREAAKTCGVSAETFDKWMSQGVQDETDRIKHHDPIPPSIYSRFYRAIAVAGLDITIKLLEELPDQRTSGTTEDVEDILTGLPLLIGRVEKDLAALDRLKKAVPGYELQDGQALRVRRVLDRLVRLYEKTKSRGVA